MSAITYKCPNCGAGLTFNPEKQKFTCEYCDSEFEEEALISRAAAEEKRARMWENERPNTDTEGNAVYICQSCGAQIITDETTAATFCYYCKNPVILAGKLDADKRPHFVLPFKISREEAKKRFTDWIKLKKYVPPDFYSEARIEEITGVYYPYWDCDYKAHASFSGEGTVVTTSTTRDYIVTKTDYYDITREADIDFANVMRSALRKADRKLADGVQPYNDDEMVDFSSAYLSGFIAENRDVDSDEVRPDIERELSGYVQPILTRGTRYTSIRGNTRTDFFSRDYKYVLFPAWVLTYKAPDGKIYSFSMNGQTGNVCGKLPVWKSKLLRTCALIGGALFLLGCIMGYLI